MLLTYRQERWGRWRRPCPPLSCPLCEERTRCTVTCWCGGRCCCWGTAADCPAWSAASAADCCSSLSLPPAAWKLRAGVGVVHTSHVISAASSAITILFYLHTITAAARNNSFRLIWKPLKQQNLSKVNNKISITKFWWLICYRGFDFRKNWCIAYFSLVQSLFNEK